MSVYTQPVRHNPVTNAEARRLVCGTIIRDGSGRKFFCCTLCEVNGQHVEAR